MPAPPYIIHTGKDGKLVDMGSGDVQDIVQALAASGTGVLHFHGGLVNRNKGIALAERLDPVYRQAQAEPVFFVWESGFLETVTHNLHEIETEKIFRILLKRVLKHVVGKLTADAGQKAAGQLPYPKDPELAIELDKLEEGTEPYVDLEVPGDVDDTTDQEREKLETELRRDNDFQAEARAIAREALPAVAEELDGSKGVVATGRKSAKSLMSRDVVEELEADTEQGQKGLLTTAKLIARAGKILLRVIRRLRTGRGHGVYVTTVEEILRELYIANIGGGIWHMMKKETADTFSVGVDRGGRVFVDELGTALAQAQPSWPAIDLVGHSTGAVYILNLLKHVETCRAHHLFPEDFSFRSVVFLAPACDFDAFEEALDDLRHLFDGFRLFAMRDELEKKDNLVPGLYPRSLLYFVSGVVEREPDGSTSFDRPILGMERYFLDAEVYDQIEVEKARQFLAASDRHAVWSIAADGADGLRSNSNRHGGFDDTDPQDPARHTTMLSVQHMIRHGPA
jgi:hypothetical protein